MACATSSEAQRQVVGHVAEATAAMLKARGNSNDTFFNRNLRDIWDTNSVGVLVIYGRTQRRKAGTARPAGSGRIGAQRSMSRASREEQLRDDARDLERL